jgi:hypothetical protein
MERETLKSLRAKARELRSKVSSAPLSKATPDQLRSEILMLERAVKAEEKVALRKALKEATVVKPLEKKKTSVAPIKSTKAVPAPTKKTADEREKELLKREKELAKREKLLLQSAPKAPESDSDDD